MKDISLDKYTQQYFKEHDLGEIKPFKPNLLLFLFIMSIPFASALCVFSSHITLQIVGLGITYIFAFTSHYLRSENPQSEVNKAYVYLKGKADESTVPLGITPIRGLYLLIITYLLLATLFQGLFIFLIIPTALYCINLYQTYKDTNSQEKAAMQVKHKANNL